MSRFLVAPIQPPVCEACQAQPATHEIRCVWSAENPPVIWGRYCHDCVAAALCAAQEDNDA